jgi:hypothetical protein
MMNEEWRWKRIKNEEWKWKQDEEMRNGKGNRMKNEE